MGKIKFSLYKLSGNGGGKGQTCARHVSSGTKRMEDICDRISDETSFTSADVKGMLEAFVNYVGNELSFGYRVEMEGLGYFSPSLRSKCSLNEDGSERVSVSVNTINFRCSERLKKKMNSTGMSRVTKKKTSIATEEDRNRRALDYLRANDYINIREYASLNGCTVYRAKQDLEKMLSEKKIGSVGYKTHRSYVLRKEEG